MGPDKDSPVRPKNQATGSRLGSWGCRRRARCPRRRVCLLKGCGRVFSAPAADGTVLLCGVRPASAPVEAVEGAAPLLPVGERQAEATGAEPPLPGAPKGTASARKRYRCRREGHPYAIVFRAPATARAAMRSSTGVGGRPCSGFVRPACRHALERVLQRERRWRARRRGPRQGNNTRRTGHPLRR